MATFNSLPNELQTRILDLTITAFPPTQVYSFCGTTSLDKVPNNQDLTRFNAILDISLVNKHFANLTIGIIGRYLKHERTRTAFQMEVYPMAYVGALSAVEKMLFWVNLRDDVDMLAVIEGDETPQGMTTEQHAVAKREVRWADPALRCVGRKRVAIWNRVVEMEVHLAPLLDCLTRYVSNGGTPSTKNNKKITKPSAKWGEPLFTSPAEALTQVELRENNLAICELCSRWADVVNTGMDEAIRHEEMLADPEPPDVDSEDEEAEFWDDYDEDEYWRERFVFTL